MKIEDAIENLQTTIMVEETKHSMRDADGELEHGETKRHIEQVESLKMGISALEKQIHKPLNMDHCSCGMAIDKGWKHCPDCGQAIEPPENKWPATRAMEEFAEAIKQQQGLK